MLRRCQSASRALGSYACQRVLNTFQRSLRSEASRVEVLGGTRSFCSGVGPPSGGPPSGGPPQPPSSSEVKEDEVDLESLVRLEVELRRQEGGRVPGRLTEAQWAELASTASSSARRRYLSYLFANEKKREGEEAKKERRRREREARRKEEEEVPPEEGGHLRYGLWRNSIFLKILDTTVNRFHHSRVVQAMTHGQPLLIDLGFDANMTPRERQNCAYQIQLLIGLNRIHDDPYNLQLCNAERSADTVRRLERYIPPLFQPEYPLVVTPESYLDLYPRERLVYLTPHCRDEMTLYDHEAVYVVGGIVDKSSGDPLTLAKAKREGVRMRKLPLDRFLSWGIGGKSLTLNQIVSIMLDIKHTGDWHHALRHVPKRKLRPQLTRDDLEGLLQERRNKTRRSSSLHYQSRRNLN